MPGLLALSLPLLLALSSAEVLCPGNRTGNDLIGLLRLWVLLPVFVVKPVVPCKAVDLRLPLVSVALVYFVIAKHATEGLLHCLLKVASGWPPQTLTLIQDWRSSRWHSLWCPWHVPAFWLLAFFLPTPLGAVCHPLCSLALTSVSPLHPTPPGPAGSSPLKAFAAVWLIVLFRVSCCVCLCSAKIMVQRAWRAGALQQRSLGPPPSRGWASKMGVDPKFLEERWLGQT